MDLSGAFSINGGAGNDTIQITNITGGISAGESNIVYGGAGTDTVQFGGTATYLIADTAQQISGLSYSASLAGVINYESGDVIQLGTSLAVTTALATDREDTNNATSYVASSVTNALAGVMANIGDVAAWSDGTDTYLVVGTAASTAASAVVFQVKGKDLVYSTAASGTAVTYDTSNFGFTLSTSNGGLSITLA